MNKRRRLSRAVGEALYQGSNNRLVWPIHLSVDYWNMRPFLGTDANEALAAFHAGQRELHVSRDLVDGLTELAITEAFVRVVGDDARREK